MPRRIVIASNNRHKITELRHMLAATQLPALQALEVVSASELGPAPDIEETSDEFIGNALLKANGIAAWLESIPGTEHDLVIADDSGLCVDALDGGPGVYSARFAGPAADDEANNRKLVAELRARNLDRSPAHYVCVLAVRVGRSPDAVCLEGRCHGEVRTERRGTGGFGYDPYFWFDGGSKTFAELGADEKSQRSHRGAAMRTLLAELPRLLG